MVSSRIFRQSRPPRDGSAFSPDRIAHLRQKLLLTVALAALLGLWVRLDIGCVWQRLLGIPCPGCGMTRAYAALFRGDIRAAFSLHFLFPVLPLLYLEILFDGRLFRRRWADLAFLSAVGAGFMLHWLLLLFG